MGEATHGTREFFQLKHRLLEFLVREMGFRTLAMEASAAASRAVNAYVQHGTGNARSALAGLGFWTWRTEEVLTMIEWMREYNSAVPPQQRVTFAGIDPQRCAAALDALEAFLNNAAPERAAPLRGTFDSLGTAAPGSLPDPERRLVHEARELTQFLQEERPALAVRTSNEAVDHALHNAALVIRAADTATRPLMSETATDSALAARDQYMADTVAALHDEGPCDKAPGKVAVWAHNGHIMTGHYANGVPALGLRLRERYGDAYYALGLLFGKGSFRARRDHKPTHPPARHGISSGGPRSVEAQLAAAHRTDHLVDLRRGKDSPPVDHWLNERHYLRGFGSSVPRLTYRLQLTPTTLANDYDGLAYLAKSSCTRLLDLPTPET
ncbi:erythromycin esterase family protein [Streptomyces violascens]|uniref:erythromycin esterase family protein n=1 Tax=Streptomyces violascens TaxID=67381 RepID=UPI0036687213